MEAMWMSLVLLFVTSSPSRTQKWYRFSSISIAFICTAMVHQIATMEMPQVPTTTVSSHYSSPIISESNTKFHQPSVNHNQYAGVPGGESGQVQTQIPQTPVLAANTYSEPHPSVVSGQKQLHYHHPYDSNSQSLNYNTTKKPRVSHESSFSSSYGGQSNESAEIIYSQPLILPDDYSPPSYPIRLPQTMYHHYRQYRTTTTTTTTTTTPAPKVYYYTNPYLNNTLAEKVLASGKYHDHFQYFINDQKTIVVTKDPAGQDPDKPQSRPPPSPPVKASSKFAPVVYGTPDRPPHSEFKVQSSFSVPKNVNAPKPRRPDPVTIDSTASNEQHSKNTQPSGQPSPWKPIVVLPPSPPSPNRRPNVPHHYIKMKPKPIKQLNAVRTALNLAKSRQHRPSVPGGVPSKFQVANVNSLTGKPDGSGSSVSVRFVPRGAKDNNAANSRPVGRPDKHSDKHLIAAASQGAVHRPFPVPRFVPVPEVIEIVEPIPHYYTVYKQVYVTKEIPIPKFIPFIIPIPIPKKKIVTKQKTIEVPKPEFVEVPHHVPKPMLVPIHKPIPLPIFRPVEVEVPVVKEEYVYVKKPYPVFVDSHGNIIGSHHPNAAGKNVVNPTVSENPADNIKDAESAKKPLFQRPRTTRPAPQPIPQPTPRHSVPATSDTKVPTKLQNR